MTGKVFPESANIYEDEAKVLFDYYRRAAERIISEEDTLQDQINYMQESLDQNTKKAEEANSKAKKMLIAAIVAAAAGVLLGFSSLSVLLWVATSFTPVRKRRRKRLTPRGERRSAATTSLLLWQKRVISGVITG